MPRRKEPTLSAVFEDLRADFRAGKDTRFTSRLSGVSSSGSGQDYHYRDERQFLHMMERARHYQRNDQVVGQGVRRLVANIVQDGFVLDTNTPDAGLNIELKNRWGAWADDPDQCHSEGELTWHQMERLFLSSVIVDGDVLALPLSDGHVQPVEAHRLRTPRGTKKNVVHGVLLNKAAKRLEYWLTKEDIGTGQALNRVSDTLPYQARDPETGLRQVLHLYDPYRFSQRRGVTCLAPVSDTVGMHDDVQFATLVKAQMAALIAILHERGADWEPGADQQKGERETETVGGYTRTIEGVSAGLEIFGDRGEKLDLRSPNIPSPEFFPHSKLLLTFIAVNLDMPVHMLLLDPSDTNFSGWRGAIDQARLRFRQIQQWLIDALHSRIYRWKVRQWAKLDPAIARAGSDGAMLLHRWHAPSFPYIEPLTDAGADLLQQRNGLNSPRRIQARKGQDWDEISTEIVADNGMAIRKALKEAKDINAEYPEAHVHWRELISLPTPDGVQIALQDPSAAQAKSGAQDQPQKNGRAVFSRN